MACTALHKDHDEVEGIHQIHNWVFADSTERLNFAYDTDDVGKVARQEDDGYFYLLTDAIIPEFVQLGADGGGGAPASLRGAMSGVLLVKGLNITSHGTITSALASAASGDAVYVGPGLYSESFTVPVGVSLIGTSSETVTIVGSITANRSSTIQELSVSVPNAGIGISYGDPLGALTLIGVDFIGNGTGSAIQVTDGFLVCFRVLYLSGSIDTAFDIQGGKMLISNCNIGGGTVINAILNNGGVLELNALNIQDTANVSNGINIQAASQNLLSTFVLDGVAIGVRLNADDATFEMLSSTFKNSTSDITVQSGISTGVFHVIGCQLQESKFNIAGSFAGNTELLLNFVDEEIGDVSVRNWNELHVGHAERGFESVFGEGDSYVRGMIVLTTDSTATSTTDGSSFVDESIPARSLSGSTFSFQGTAANHTILVCSDLENNDGSLKHWGWKVAQTTAMIGGSVAFEIWDGAAWSQIGIMATDSSKFYRYANNVFLREDNSEHIRFGIDDGWATKTIDGVDGYWSRVRITSGLTTAPVFEQFKLSTSRSELNETGTFTTHGLGRFKIDLSNSGNVFGESGGVATGSITVGSGGVPNGWSHQIKNSILNNAGDALYFQFNLPKGVDTSFPLECDLSYIPFTAGSGNASVIVSLLPQEMVGVLIADPSGAEVPIARTAVSTDIITTNAAQTDTQNLPNTDVTKIRKADFGGYDVSSYYEGDLVLGRIEMDSSDGGGDLAILTVSIRGVTWTLGERLV